MHGGSREVHWVRPPLCSRAARCWLAHLRRACSLSETGVYNDATGELDNVKFMAMREKIVAMKDDDIKAGVEEAKELEAENAPCTITAFLFQNACRLPNTTYRHRDKKTKRKKNTAAVLRRGTGLLQLGCANTCAFRSRVCIIAMHHRSILLLSRVGPSPGPRCQHPEHAPRQRPTHGTSSRGT